MAQIKITHTSNADINIGVAKQITMAQQTAVEWLIEQLKQVYDKEGKLPLVYTFELLRQAKQMEKEQIMKSFSVGNDCGYCFAKTEDSQQFNSGEQYYNETYNK